MGWRSTARVLKKQEWDLNLKGRGAQVAALAAFRRLFGQESQPALKVYGVTRMSRVRLGSPVYVAAPNKQAAARELRVSSYNLDHYPAPPPDEEARRACMERPGALVKGAPRPQT